MVELDLLGVHVPGPAVESAGDEVAYVDDKALVLEKLDWHFPLLTIENGDGQKRPSPEPS